MGFWDGNTALRGEIESGRDRARVKRGGVDLPFLALTLVILCVGVIMLLSASYTRAFVEQGRPMNVFLRQAAFAGFGIAALLVISRLPVGLIRGVTLPVLVISTFLLVIVLFIGTKVNGARRWLDLGFTTFQPSEAAKLAVIMFFAHYCANMRTRMKTFKFGVLPFLLVGGVFTALLLGERHLSATMIILAITLVMMFAGGARTIWPLLAIALIGAALLLIKFVPQLEYASSRIMAWRDPTADPQGDGYQILQSLYAIGSGGLFGEGIGQGRQKQLMFLPEERNDYIFAIICEEIGYIGAVILLLLFALLIVRGFYLALKAEDMYRSLMITGITALLSIQVFLNVAVVTNLIPATGISLPFFSSGGTALLMQLAEVGVLLACSRGTDRAEREEMESEPER
jgi:cell division protein FtsW